MASKLQVVEVKYFLFIIKNQQNHKLEYKITFRVEFVKNNATKQSALGL